MGVTVEQWRAAIGRRCRGVVLRTNFAPQTSGCSYSTTPWFCFLVLAALLVIGGVEQNPGPGNQKSGTTPAADSKPWQGAALDTSQTTFNKLPGTSGLGGQLFEIKLLSLIHLRALNLGHPFSLATNVEEYQKFDDVVFQFDQGQETCFFLQLKHRENAEKRKITRQIFLTEKSDFSLRQYYKSYVNIEDYLRGKVGDNFKNYLFILFTNADIEEKLKNKQVPEIGREKFLMTWPDRVLKFNQTEHSFIYEGLKDLPRHVEFLSQLRVMYGQKAENEMDSLVKEELLRTDVDCSDVDSLYKLYHNHIQEWWLGNFRLTQQLDINNPLTKAKHETCYNELVIKSDYIKNLGIRFETSTLQELRDHIQGNKVVVVYSPGKSSTVTTAKVRQVLTGTTKHLLVNSSDLVTNCDAILYNWKKGNFDVCVVECINKLDMDIISEIYVMLCEEKPVQKLVIVAVESEHSKEIRHIRKMFKNQDFAELEVEVRFRDLDDETQKKLLDRCIELQGVETTLASIMSQRTESLDEHTVSVLLENDKLQVGNVLEKSLEYYIDRTLICQSYVTNGILNQTGSVFAVLNTTKSELQKLVPPGELVCDFSEWHSGCRYVVIDDLQSFVHLTPQGRNGHCLRRHDDRLIWIQSTGDLDTVRRYLRTDMSAEWRPSTALDGEDRVILVTAEPGMGKSSLMTYLANQTKILDPAMWVVRVNVNAHTKTLQDIKNKGFTQEKAVEMLAEAAGVEKQGLSWKLFSTTLISGRNMLVLLDGIDEVSPRYFDQVVQIVHWMYKTNVPKIWVTGRLHMKKVLEDALGRPTFCLKPFSVGDQKSFLIKFWGSKFGTYSQEVLEKVAGNVILLAERNFRNAEKEIMGIPLQTFLMAEVLEKHFVSEDTTILPTFPEYINIFLLHNEFIEKKWEIYINEKKMADNTNVSMVDDNKILYDNFIEKHKLAALVYMFSESEISSLLNKKALSDTKNHGIQRTGIVTGEVDGRPQFVHRTFAEYFAAMWFAEHLQESRQLLSKHLLTERFQVVRRILDYALTEGYPLHLAAMNGEVDHVQCDGVDMLDKGGRTALHPAVMYQHPDVVRLLLDKGSDASVVDNVLGWTALQYATQAKNWGVITELVNARPELRDHVFGKVVINKSKTLSSCLLATVKRGLVPLLYYLVDDRGLDLNFRFSHKKRTLLHLGARYAQIEVVRWIIHYVNIESPQPNRIYQSKTGSFLDIADRDGRTALHLASLNGHQQVVRELLTAKCDHSIVDKFWNTALHSASQIGHENVIRELLAANCDVNVTNKYGWTPLYVASLYGHEEVENAIRTHSYGCGNRSDDLVSTPSEQCSPSTPAVT